MVFPDREIRPSSHYLRRTVDARDIGALSILRCLPRRASACGVVLALTQCPAAGMAVPTKFGDFEAQRHWMEVTVNLPARQWLVALLGGQRRPSCLQPCHKTGHAVSAWLTWLQLSLPL